MFAFCMFLTIYTEGFWIFILVHYLLMLLWVLAMRTNFCGSMDDSRRPVSEFVYNLVISAVLIFDIVNIKEGPTRIKNFVYYLVVFFENVLIMSLWWISKVSFLDLDKIYILVIFGMLQFFSIFFLLLYYKRFHPNRNLPDHNQPANCL